jgi:RND family efflux transporter MFP subunit
MKKFLILTIFTLISYSKEIYATFDIKASKDVNLAFSVSGIVKSVNVDVGDYVKKGEVLAILQNSDLKAALDSAKVEMDLAKKILQRYKSVKSVTDKTSLDIKEANFLKAKANYEYKKAIYEKSFLKAPFSGVIYYKNIEVGDAVTGMNPKTVFKLQSKEDRKLIIYFDQKYHKVVKVGDLFEYKVDGDNKTYITKIVKIYPYANSKNRKIKAQANVKNFMPGLFGQGYIKTED